MNGIFRLRIPKLFCFSPQLLFPLKKNSPKLHVWDTTLNCFLSKIVCSQFSSINPTGENFLLITLQELCYVFFVFLGFLTLLANFGLVAPIPDGIRVLSVETPLRT